MFFPLKQVIDVNSLIYRPLHWNDLGMAYRFITFNEAVCTQILTQNSKSWQCIMGVLPML